VILGLLHHEVAELVNICDQCVHVNAYEKMRDSPIAGDLSIKFLQNGIQYQPWIFVTFQL
jgi:hypothetical protein